MRRRWQRAPDRRGKFAADLAELLTLGMRRSGVRQVVAETAANTSIELLRRAYGGRLIYVARREAVNRAAVAKRIDELRRAGLSMKDIASRLGLSRSYCYEIASGPRHHRGRTARKRALKRRGPEAT